jgi:hypothetical protein
MDQAVYIIHCTTTKYYKVGIAKDVRKRFLSLKSGCPFDLVLVGEFYHPSAASIEQIFHQVHSNRCVRGEWFEFNSAEEVVTALRKEIVYYDVSGIAAEINPAELEKY